MWHILTYTGPILMIFISKCSAWTMQIIFIGKYDKLRRLNRWLGRFSSSELRAQAPTTKSCISNQSTAWNILGTCTSMLHCNKKAPPPDNGGGMLKLHKYSPVLSTFHLGNPYSMHCQWIHGEGQRILQPYLRRETPTSLRHICCF